MFCILDFLPFPCPCARYRADEPKSMSLPLVSIAKLARLSVSLTLSVSSWVENFLPNRGSTGGACLHFLEGPSPSSSTITTIQTPTAPFEPMRGVQWIQRLRPSELSLVTQRTLAVTPRPSARACVNSSRTRDEPPILEMNGLWRMPGTLRDGEANSMRREGYGRTRR
jgi:hypothetical protein